MRLSTLIIFVLLLLQGACARHDAASHTGGRLVSFQSLRTDVVAPKCAGCHGGVSPAASLNFSSYTDMMKSGAVVPGNAAVSSFYTSVASGSMPPGAPLSAEAVAQIAAWIDDGAKNDVATRIDSVEPAVGGAGRRTSVTINGQGFQTGASVTFGTQLAAGVSVVSSSQITCLSPSKTSGRDDITITNPDGSTITARGAFTYGAGANGSGVAVSKVFPTSGPEGTLIEINGFGFEGDSRVTVAGQPCTNLLVTPPSTITCSVPSKSQSGPADIIVTLANGEAGLFASGFTYTVSASFTALLTGTFTPKCAGCHGSSGGVTLSSYSGIMSSGVLVPRNPEDSPLLIALQSGRMPKGVGTNPPVEVTAAEKRDVENWIRNGALDDTPPDVTTIVPARGSTNGGQSVTITGSRFVPGASVLIGGSACTPVTVNSLRTAISCTTSPRPGTTTVVDVVVINPAHSGIPSRRSTGGSAIYTYWPPPTITNVSPGSVKSSNTSAITITGTHFRPGVRFKFGVLDAPANTTTIVSCDAAQVCTATCVPPPQPAAVVDLTVTNSDGQLLKITDGFAYTTGDPPVVTGISSPFGYSAENKEVTITGSNILVGATPRIGNTALTQIERISSTSIKGKVNAGNLRGSQTVTIVNPDGIVSTATNVVFDIRESLTFTATSPASGSVNGDTIATFTGTGFQVGITALVGGQPCKAPTGLQRNSATSMVCIIPPSTAGATTVQIVLSNPTDEAGVTPTASQPFTYTP